MWCDGLMDSPSLAGPWGFPGCIFCTISKRLYHVFLHWTLFIHSIFFRGQPAGCEESWKTQFCKLLSSRKTQSRRLALTTRCCWRACSLCHRGWICGTLSTRPNERSTRCVSHLRNGTDVWYLWTWTEDALLCTSDLKGLRGALGTGATWQGGRYRLCFLAFFCSNFFVCLFFAALPVVAMNVEFW